MAALVAISVMGCSRDGFPLTDAPTTQVLSGVLVGGSVDGVDCAWIQEPSGRRIEIFWPDRWSLEFDPLAIYDENRAPVISAGDSVSLSGYFAEVGASLCSGDAVFNAERVLSSGAG